MGGISIDSRRLAPLAGLIVAGAVLTGVAPGIALLLAPGLLLFAALVLGFTPGEELLERMQTRRIARRRCRPTRTLTIRRYATFVRRRISPAASALAMRPPPVAPAPIS